jgi:hypothetical protein
MDTFQEQDPKKASHTTFKIEEIEGLDKDELLKRIQTSLPGVFDHGDLEKFKAANIRGRTFVKHGCNVGFFKDECKLSVGASYELADLVKEIVGGETAGMKSKSLSFIPCTPRR